MAASSNRRKRYQPQAPARHIALTTHRMCVLQAVAELKISSVPQLALWTGLSEQSTRRHARVLFDAGFLKVIAVPRAALASSSASNDASLLFGSAPNIYTLSPKGQALLRVEGLSEDDHTLPAYGPQNSLFLRHALATTDAHIWLHRCAHAQQSHQLVSWHDGDAAAMDLQRTQPPRAVCPDAWFTYFLGEHTLVGLVEIDRGTEKGGRRWREKLTAYSHLFSSPRLKAITGFMHARVLVITPTERWRDHLADFITQHAPPHLTPRFWLTDQSVYGTTQLSTTVWRRSGSADIVPFLLSQPVGEEPAPQDRTSISPVA